MNEQPSFPMTPMQRPEASPKATALVGVRKQARRYLEARYGLDVWFRAPETFDNLLERWIWAVASNAPELAEESIVAIETGLARHREQKG